MKPALATEGRAALVAVMRLQPLLAFDFDGTLAPIVARADDAHVSKEVSQCLAQLAQRLPVAIVTGRSVVDVAPRLGFTPHSIIGNHGAEDPLDERGHYWYVALNGLRARIAAHAQALQAVGVQIEDKRFSIALHYRLAPDHLMALRSIDDLLQIPEIGWERSDGKCVVNLVAASAPDKGDAILSLVQRCGAGAAVFLGDDVNDEAAFAKAPAHWMTIRVGRDDLQSKAMYYLARPTQVQALLQAMLKELDSH